MAELKEFKAEIKRIEAEIFAITGKSNDTYNWWAHDEDKSYSVYKLLSRRKAIIEENFFPVSSGEIERLKAVNKKLNKLTKSTRKKLEKMFMKSWNERQRGEEFVVEGSLYQVYKGEDSVIKFDEDGKYGSNFTLIIKVLTEYYEFNKAKIFSIQFDSEYSPLDYEGNYPEVLIRWMRSRYAPFCKTDYYMFTEICYAAQYFVKRTLYSFADLIRLNDFKQEISITHIYTHQQSADPDLRS